MTAPFNFIGGQYEGLNEVELVGGCAPQILEIGSDFYDKVELSLGTSSIIVYVSSQLSHLEAIKKLVRRYRGETDG